MAHPKEDLLTYIREAAIFDIRALETLARINQGELQAAIDGNSEFRDIDAVSIAWIFQLLGINPLNASKFE